MEFELHKQGMVYAARSAEDARAELRGLAPMREYGYDLPDDVITGAELHELEPALSAEVTAGFLVRQHWHVKPDTITAGLAAALRRDGVDIQEGLHPTVMPAPGQSTAVLLTIVSAVAACQLVMQSWALR